MAGPFDLRQFAPPRFITFTLRDGTTYSIPGDPDVDEVAVMLRIDTEIGERTGTGLGEVLVEGKAEIKRLIALAEPDRDLSDFNISPDEVMLVLALTCHGTTVAEAVGLAIQQANAPESVAAAPGEETKLDDGRDEVGDDPLPLTGPSSVASSDSDESTDGLQATGTG